jgi:hypothetical protein
VNRTSRKLIQIQEKVSVGEWIRSFMNTRCTVVKYRSGWQAISCVSLKWAVVTDTWGQKQKSFLMAIFLNEVCDK